MTADRSHHHDPGSALEDAGIPDLQDGTPEQQWSEDPQELPVPGDRPNASVDWGTTAAEQEAGEPLSGQLAREEPDPALTEIADELSARPGQADPDRVETDPDTPVAVGRLVSEQRVLPSDVAPDTDAEDVGADSGGLTPEEQAMHVDPE